MGHGWHTYKNKEVTRKETYDICFIKVLCVRNFQKYRPKDKGKLALELNGRWTACEVGWRETICLAGDGQGPAGFSIIPCSTPGLRKAPSGMLVLLASYQADTDLRKAKPPLRNRLPSVWPMGMPGRHFVD